MAPGFLTRFKSKKDKDRRPPNRNIGSGGRSTTTASQSEARPASAPLLSLDIPSASFATHPSSRGYDSLGKSTIGIGHDVDIVDGDANEAGQPESYAASPWVDLGKRQGDNGATGVLSGSLSRAELARCQRARLPPQQAEEAIRLCGAVIKERGLETLGLMRPWRSAENQVEIGRLKIHLLNYLQPPPPAAQSAGEGEAVFQQQKQKDTTVEDVNDELMFASVSNVAAVFKWVLRHTFYPSSTGFGTSLAWYTTFCSTEKAQKYPKDAYTSILLPLLPAASQKLLDAALDILSAIASHAEQNAMPAARLCRTFGFWLFGKAEASFSTYGELYAEWDRSGKALEHIFSAYLRGQHAKLPRRLRELVEGYPGTKAADGDGFRPQVTTTTIQVVHVRTETEGVWSTDKDVQGATGLRRRKSADARPVRSGSTTSVNPASFPKPDRSPVETIIAALGGAQTPHEGNADDAAEPLWQAVRAQAQKDDTTTPPTRPSLARALSDETVRILDIAYPDTSGRPEPLRTSQSFRSTASRRRSFSLDSPSAQQGRFLTTLYEDRTPTKATTPTTEQKSPSKSPQAPSWNDFVAGGFAETTTNLSVDLKAPSTPESQPTAGPTRPQQHKGRPSFGLHRPSSKAPSGRAMKSEESLVSSVAAPATTIAEEPAKPTTTVTAVETKTVDETFPDFWLDALGDVGILNRWPCFVISAVQPQLVTPGAPRFLSVEEILKTAKSAEAEAEPDSRPLSPTPSNATQKKRLRPDFATFGRKSSRKSALFSGLTRKDRSGSSTSDLAGATSSSHAAPAVPAVNNVMVAPTAPPASNVVEDLESPAKKQAPTEASPSTLASPVMTTSLTTSTSTWTAGSDTVATSITPTAAVSASKDGSPVRQAGPDAAEAPTAPAPGDASAPDQAQPETVPKADQAEEVAEKERQAAEAAEAQARQREVEEAEKTRAAEAAVAAAAEEARREAEAAEMKRYEEEAAAAKAAEEKRLQAEAEAQRQREAEAAAAAAAEAARLQAEAEAARQREAEEAAERARIETERKEAEEAKRQAALEAERKAAAEAERKAKEENERLAAEQAARQEKEEAGRKEAEAKEEAERRAAEAREAEAKELAEREAEKQRQEAERVEQEKQQALLHEKASEQAKFADPEAAESSASAASVPEGHEARPVSHEQKTSEEPYTPVQAPEQHADIPTPILPSSGDVSPIVALQKTRTPVEFPEDPTQSPQSSPDVLRTSSKSSGPTKPPSSTSSRKSFLSKASSKIRTITTSKSKSRKLSVVPVTEPVPALPSSAGSTKSTDGEGDDDIADIVARARASRSKPSEEQQGSESDQKPLSTPSDETAKHENGHTPLGRVESSAPGTTASESTPRTSLDGDAKHSRPSTPVHKAAEGEPVDPPSPVHTMHTADSAVRESFDTARTE